MTVLLEVPGRPVRRLEHLLLDVNGTLTRHGLLLPGIAERVRRLRNRLSVRLLTADTYGTATEVARQLGVGLERVAAGADKAAVADRLGPAACAAVGNGANDEALLRTVALGIAVLGPEGSSPRALLAADVVCPSALVALDLLADERALAATLRP
ncbi:MULTISPECIES: HAD family hydrolase [Micromonospora]|uniref:HAD family hydrolase n=1 Tax=Micromonospora solifontis TaxID=2487138 RepID=A0ABX9WC13_9ACTN|nr:MULTISPECIES: HAD family hydrolase [Micromonospora]NES16996.1 HAD family hydrolase [Micromonospora sp. PPF5-17B]NES38409.1 HAD family hydrolase [Micromonospora solifontis]NES58723.1 HAD family hydrolase [Micromonospora sp. PPF5-6]RNL95824.1 HAD family hydrolase [Micromonospora solifontis]